MKWLVFALFSLSLSSCLVTKKKFDAQKALADRCDSTLADCADKLKKAEADLSLLKGSESDLRSKLEKENAENESLNAKYTKLNGDFEQSQKQYEDLKARMEALGKNSLTEKESLKFCIKAKGKGFSRARKTHSRIGKFDR
jgi:peptidoglycan hydrolase CwlO-like protein